MRCITKGQGHSDSKIIKTKEDENMQDLERKLECKTNMDSKLDKKGQDKLFAAMDLKISAVVEKSFRRWWRLRDRRRWEIGHGGWGIYVYGRDWRR